MLQRGALALFQADRGIVTSDVSMCDNLSDVWSFGLSPLD